MYNQFGTPVVLIRELFEARSITQYLCKLPKDDRYPDGEDILIQYSDEELYNSLENIPELPEIKLRSNVSNNKTRLSITDNRGHKFYTDPRSLSRAERNGHQDINRSLLLDCLNDEDGFNEINSLFSFKIYRAPLTFE